MQGNKFNKIWKIIAVLAVAALTMFILYNARHMLTSKLLPYIKYFDRLIRTSLVDMKEEMTAYKLISFAGFSFLYGLIHSAGPGHGKSIMSAYFLSHRQNLKRAFTLAGVISLTHILSSVALSFVFAAFIKNAGAFFKIRVQGYLIAASGAMILLIGLFLLTKKLFFDKPDKQSGGSVIYDNPFILGISTGIAPCPVTIFLMTFAIAQGIPVIGLVSVLSLAAGMFTLLSLVGIAAIKGRSGMLSLFANKSSRRIENIAEAIELISLALIVFVGGGMVAVFLA